MVYKNETAEEQFARLADRGFDYDMLFALTPGEVKRMYPHFFTSGATLEEIMETLNEILMPVEGVLTGPLPVEMLQKVLESKWV